MATLTKDQYQKRIAALRTERESFIPTWTDIRDYIFPFRGRFTRDEDPNDGKRRDRKINNNRPTNFARIMAAGMMAGTATQSRPWFRLRTFDSTLMENAEVKLWLDIVQRRIYEILSGSNFYDALPVAYLEMVLFGTAAMGVFEDREDIVRFYNYTAGTYMVGNDSRGKARVFAREYKRRPDQLVEEFGIENVSQQVRTAYENNNIDKNYISIAHIIEPNDEARPGFVDNLNMPYRSVYYECAASGNKFLRRSGFRDFPIMIPRWSLCDSDAYGTEQPSAMALGDAKELQSAQYLKKDGIVRTVKPPLQAPHDLANSNIMNVPGGTTFYNQFGNAGGVRNLYDTKIPLGDMVEDIKETEARLREAYMVDLFMALLTTNRPSDMKAEVAAGMTQERMLILGPVLERIHHELLNPTINRVFDIGERGGVFPPAPKVLENKPLKIVYTSVLAQAQQAVGIGSIERLSGLVGSFAQFNAEVVDKIDFDQAVDEAADMLGVVPTIIRTDDAVAKIRAERAQKESGATTLAATSSAADTAKTLSQAPVGGSNLLEKLTGAA